MQVRFTSPTGRRMFGLLRSLMRSRLTLSGPKLGFLVLCLLPGAPQLAANETDELVTLVTTLLSEADGDLRALGYEQIRTAAPGAEATRRFAELLPTLAGPAQVGLLGALADRGDRAALPLVVKLYAESTDPAVRNAALEALGPLGTVAEIPTLVSVLRDGTPDEQAMVQRSLVRLSDEGVVAALVQQARSAPVPVQLALMEVFTTRRSLDAIPYLLEMAVGSDAAVRRGAMLALAQLGGPEQIPGMVQGVLKAAAGSEREAAEKGVMQVCSHISNPDARAEPLLKLLESLSPTDRNLLLPTVGRVGGSGALRLLEKSLADPSLHEAALRGICNWPDASLAPRLQELAQHEKSPEQRIAALRALIRVAVLADARSDDERLAILRTAMQLSTRDAERNLVLKRAQAIRSLASLQFLLESIGKKPHTAQACESVVELAHHRKLRESHKEEFMAALDQVIQLSQDAIVVERAQRYKEGRTWTGPANQAAASDK